MDLLLTYWWQIAAATAVLMLTVLFLYRYRGRLLRITRNALSLTIVATMTFVYVVAGMLFLLAYPLIGIVVAAFSTAFVLFLFILPVIPGMIALLANDPNRYRPDDPEEANKRRYRPSRFGFFTALAPGQSKWVETQGERAMRAPMRNPEYLYAGEKRDSEYSGRNPAYWEVEDTPSDEEDSHPIPFPSYKWKGWRLIRWYLYSPMSILWWVWKRWVYEWTGYVWVGPYPYRRIRVSRVDRYNIVELGDGLEKLELVRDFSDHYRVIDFQFSVVIPAAITKDKIPLRIVVNAICRVVNTYKVAYFTDDRWSIRLTGAIRDAIINFMRTREVDNVLTPEGDPDRTAEQALAMAIQAIGIGDGEARNFGITLPVLPQIRQFTLAEDTDRIALSRPRRARAEREADIDLAQGKAAYISEQGQALHDFPEALVANIPQNEAWIDVAEKLNEGRGTGILNMGGAGQPIDPTQIALLRELRQLREQSRPPQESEAKQADERSGT